MSPEHTEEAARTYLGGVESGRCICEKGRNGAKEPACLRCSRREASCPYSHQSATGGVLPRPGRCTGTLHGHTALPPVDGSTAAREGLCAIYSVSHVPGSTVAEPGQQNSPASLSLSAVPAKSPPHLGRTWAGPASPCEERPGDPSPALTDQPGIHTFTQCHLHPS